MKNIISKIAYVMLSFVFVLSTCMTVFAVTSLSVSNKQDGIEATLNFSKQEYSENENVEVTLNVKNNNSYAVNNIQTELIVPSTMNVSKGSLKQEAFSLNAMESKAQEVALEKVVEKNNNVPTTNEENKTNSPQTRDNVVIYIAMMIVSAVAIVVIVVIVVKKKWIHKKKVMSLVLCFTLVGAMTLTSVVNAEARTKEFTVEGTIKYNGEDIVIKGKVTYTHEIYSKLQVNGVDKGMYVEGDTVTITAEEKEGQHFTGWTVVKGNVTLANKNGSTTTFVMGTEEVEIKANYEVNTYTIEVTSGENGKISPSGNVSVEYGKGQIFTVTANENCHIDSIEIDGQKQHNLIGVGNIWKNETIRFTDVKENHKVKVTFAIDTSTITSSANAGGTITESATVNYGDSKTYTITANTGYHIEKVVVDGEDKGKITSYTFTDVKENHTINVTFAIDTFTITATAGAHGTITENATVNYNDNTTFTITPNTGYGVVDVKVDGTSVGAVTSYEFKNVVKNHTIEVVFGVATEESFRNAIIEGGTVELASDITLHSDLHLDESNDDITIVGNGFLISGAAIFVDNGMILTCKNLNVSSKLACPRSSWGGTLILDGGTYDNLFLDSGIAYFYSGTFFFDGFNKAGNFVLVLEGEGKFINMLPEDLEGFGNAKFFNITEFHDRNGIWGSVVERKD